MWRFILLFIAGFFLYKLVVGEKKKAVERKTAETEKLKATGELVKDPECGSYCNKETAVRIKDGDKVLFFCGFECRDAYLKKLAASGKTVVPEANADPEAGSGAEKGDKAA